MDPKKSPSTDPSGGEDSKEAEIERREDQEGIPGYGQPPKEVRTRHPGAGRKDNPPTEPSPFD